MMNSYRMFETRTADNVALVSDGVAISGAGTTYSLPVPTPNDGAGGYEITSSGTLAGTLTRWLTDKDDPDLSSDTDWIQDTAWVPTNPAGAATKTKYSFDGMKGRWFRIKFVYSGGSGTLAGKSVH